MPAWVPIAIVGLASAVLGWRLRRAAPWHELAELAAGAIIGALLGLGVAGLTSPDAGLLAAVGAGASALPARVTTGLLDAGVSAVRGRLGRWGGGDDA